MQELLHNEALKLRSMLAVSTMVYNHCQKQGCSSRAVDDIMQSLEGIIGYRCSVNDGNIKAVSYKFSYLEPREGRGGWEEEVHVKEEEEEKEFLSRNLTPFYRLQEEEEEKERAHV